MKRSVIDVQRLDRRMRPPQWVLKNSRRLDLGEFGWRFSIAWARTQTRFIKVECWQTYEEVVGDRSQHAYDQGDLRAARILMRQEAEADRSLYDDIRARQLDYSRIRLVQEPLSPYLRYEMEAYRIRAELGERIEIVRCHSGIRLPNAEHFDFLMFDRHTALIHDYDPGGRQTGGWLTREPDVISLLERRAVRLHRTAVPLHDYTAVPVR
jgi:Family of unknown function (DUF6879)